MSNATEQTPVRCAIQDGVATLTFNRPEAMNALDAPTARAFLAACEQLRDAPSLRAVLLRGEGKAFMAGGDLRSMHDDPAAVADDLIAPMHAGLQRLAELPVPVVAAVQGAVAGAGISVMLAADVVLAAERTRFNLAYAQVGGSGDLGVTWALPRAVGLQRALALMLLCDTVPAEEALAIGLVQRLVPAGALQQEAAALAARLAAGPTRAYGHIRRLLRQSFEQPFAAQLAAEACAFADCTATADFLEGTGAFLARRAPRFTGH